MTKVRTTLTVDAEVLRAVKVRAARTGKGDSEVIEEAIRRDLGLELLDRLWAANRLDEEESLALGVEAFFAYATVVGARRSRCQRPDLGLYFAFRQPGQAGARVGRGGVRVDRLARAPRRATASTGVP